MGSIKGAIHGSAQPRSHVDSHARRTSTGCRSTRCTSSGSTRTCATRIYLERGYGERFGVSDEQLAPLVAGLLPREELIAECDVILLPKPLPRTSPSCARGRSCGAGRTASRTSELTQLAIDRRLTLIAFEAMNHWTADGSFNLHVFHKNNELAGYCSVLHALATHRADRRLRPAAAGRRHRLRRDRPRRGDGPQRPRRARRRRPHPPRRRRGRPRRSTRRGSCSFEPRRRRPAAAATPSPTTAAVPLAGFLAEHDIIVNCVLQDTDAPLMFLTERRPGRLRARAP